MGDVREIINSRVIPILRSRPPINTVTNHLIVNVRTAWVHGSTLRQMPTHQGGVKAAEGPPPVWPFQSHPVAALRSAAPPHRMPTLPNHRAQIGAPRHRQ